jgi:diguanylate cyclase (GGDEF)-like protein
MTISIVTLVRLFLYANALVLVLMAAVAWNRRHRVTEAGTLTLLMLSAVIYCVGYAGEIGQTTLPGAIFWLHVEYMGSPWLPAFWLLLARKHYHLPSRTGLLMVVPLLTFVAQWTNPLHSLYDRVMWMEFRSPFWVVSVVRGPLAWLFLVYLYSALLYGTWIYISKFRHSTRLCRVQSLLFASSALPPLVGYLIYLVGWSPWGLDLAPVMISFSAIMGYFAVFRLEFFDLVPMARSLVFNSMRDAVYVTDLRYRLVDLNPAARQLSPHLDQIDLGDEFSVVLSKLHPFQEAFNDSTSLQSLDLSVDGELQNFAVRVLPLGLKEHQSGWAVILANVTAQVRLLHELRHYAETDQLTGVANRRSFIIAIERESARSKRHNSLFSVLVLDVDEFKGINDRLGHPTGDRVLTACVNRILSCLRQIDMLGRLGGDEFAVLLPEAGSDGASEVAERIRSSIADKPIEIGDESIKVSVSIGLATISLGHSADWKQLLEAADRGLYRAKAEGRNRVASAD